MSLVQLGFGSKVIDRAHIIYQQWWLSFTICTLDSNVKRLLKLKNLSRSPRTNQNSGDLFEFDYGDSKYDFVLMTFSEVEMCTLGLKLTMSWGGRWTDVQLQPPMITPWIFDGFNENITPTQKSHPATHRPEITITSYFKSWSLCRWHWELDNADRCDAIMTGGNY